jgi:protein TonB
MRPVALARPTASAHEGSAASQGDAASARPAAVGSDSGADRGGAGSPGAADGGAGDDSNSIAHADYARNPPPIYPAVARRREQQGTVTVRVLVGADGSVERAEIADSSGFDALDDAALETVRSRWRFVPARHDGLAVESWVLVPIRFALLEANAVR